MSIRFPHHATSLKRSRSRRTYSLVSEQIRASLQSNEATISLLCATLPCFLKPALAQHIHKPLTFQVPEFQARNNLYHHLANRLSPPLFPTRPASSIRTDKSLNRIDTPREYTMPGWWKCCRCDNYLPAHLSECGYCGHEYCTDGGGCRYPANRQRGYGGCAATGLCEKRGGYDDGDEGCYYGCDSRSVPFSSGGIIE